MRGTLMMLFTKACCGSFNVLYEEIKEKALILGWCIEAVI